MFNHSPIGMHTMAFFGLLLCLASAFIYLLPSFMAYKKHHKNFASIALLNILLGWTFLGWVAALVWAFSKQEDAVKTIEAIEVTPEQSPIIAEPVNEFKKCPFCAEDIKAAAIKCKHCGSDLTEK